MTRPSIRVLIAALIVLVASTTLAQSSVGATATVKPTGTVYDKVGNPLPDIRVELWRDGADEGDLVAVRRTTDTGRVTFPAVPKSSTTKYYLSAKDLTGHYADTLSATFAPKTTAAPDIKMDAAGFIVGTVSTKVDGNTVPSADVEVLALGDLTAGLVHTAANGTFRIGGLRSGTYVLSFLSPVRPFFETCYDNERPGKEGCSYSTKVTVKAGKVTTINPQQMLVPQGAHTYR